MQYITTAKHKNGIESAKLEALEVLNKTGIMPDEKSIVALSSVRNLGYTAEWIWSV